MSISNKRYPLPVSKRQAYWLAAGLVVVLLLVVVWPLHLGTRISGSAEQQLYNQTTNLISAETQYAAAHQGQYAGSLSNLATSYPDLSYALGGSSPVVEYQVNSGVGQGYYAELANQSTGGAASFSVVFPDSGKPRLSCVGPSPLCNNGTFKLPARIDKQLAKDQHQLYNDTIELIKAQQKYFAANHRYASSTLQLALTYPSLAWTIDNTSPVTVLATAGTGYYMRLTGVSPNGDTSFTVLVPNTGPPTYTCTGTAPLCTNGTFHS